MTAQLNVDVRFHPQAFVGALDAVAKQMPWATKKALDNTAGLVQDVVCHDLPRHFTIRSTWVSKGIRVHRASKSRLVAAVGSVDPFMERQAYGGRKEAQGGGMLAVPRGVRSKPTQRTTRARWPGRLLQRKNHFLMPLPSGDVGLFRRYKSGRLKLMYVLTESVTVEKRWPFFDVAWELIKREWPHQQVKALLEALKTARW